MASSLVLVRAMWPTSLIEAVTVTILGVVFVAVGLRLFRVLGPAELELLEQASIPGKRLLIRWLSSSPSH